MSQPRVIAHRGSSGYRPENTIEAFELGLAQGADGIEFDLVTTKDQKLIVRHENALSETTNIASQEGLESFRRKGSVEGEEVFDWFSEDLTLSQIASLRAIERTPELRPGSAKFDSEFAIPTLGNLLDAKCIDGKILVIELKSGSHNKRFETSMAKLLADEISMRDLSARGIHLFIESFDSNLLISAKEELSQRKLQAKFLLALDEKIISELDLVELSSEFDGISISLAMLFAEPDWVANCHQQNMEVWTYTARAEQAETSIEEYYEKIIDTGVDAIFADQPDLLRRVLVNRTGSAYDY